MWLPPGTHRAPSSCWGEGEGGTGRRVIWLPASLHLVALLAAHAWCPEAAAELQLPILLSCDPSAKGSCLLHHRCAYCLRGQEEGMQSGWILSLSASHLLNCFPSLHIPVKSGEFWLTV